MRKSAIKIILYRFPPAKICEINRVIFHQGDESEASFINLSCLFFAVSTRVLVKRQSWNGKIPLVVVFRGTGLLLGRDGVFIHEI